MTTPETITQLPLSVLHESAFNPRKTYAALDELAASIRAEGIHQPLVVRPRLMNVLRPDIVDEYEVVFGHRRLRAAELAGLETVPCIVRAMSDLEARRAQLTENIQRADVHPIEEAEAFGERVGAPARHPRIGVLDGLSGLEFFIVSGWYRRVEVSQGEAEA